MCYLSFPSTVRVGRDIFVDCDRDSKISYQFFESAIDKLAENYRIHITHTGDHNDGIFCPVAPGQIVSTHYRKKYQDTFPDWNVFFLPDTSNGNGYNGSWWVPGKDYACYNETVIEKAKNWIGNFKETIFEVNMLVIDQHNVICIAENDAVCRHLESLGIQAHVVDYRDRGFCDGGLHCLTVDIHRDGEIIDYWPNRGENQKHYY
jgi:N-dimethylarginine dimethylaminohydrolase